MQNTAVHTHITATSPQANGDIVNVRIIIGEGGSAFILYDRPFNKLVSWFEYNLDKNSLEFIMEDGDIRDFGIPVARDVGRYLQNVHFVSFVHANGTRINDSFDLPLIVHKC